MMEVQLKSQNDILEGFLSLWDHLSISLFPRKAMGAFSKGQVEVKSKEDLRIFLAENQFLDCFLQTHTQEDKAKGFLYIVFIDLDFPDLRRAREVLRRILHVLRVKYNLNPYAQYSGNRGYHILIPIEPIIINPPTMVGPFLKYLQLKLSLGYCDPQILGDVVRLCRIPNTWNSKGIRQDKDALVKVIQEWDGQRLDISEFREEFRLKLLQEELNKGKLGLKAKPKPTFKAGRIRSQVLELIEKARQGINLTHQQRLAVLLELIAEGWTDDQILEVFSHQPDFDHSRTKYMVEHARRAGYKPFTSKKLQEVLANG
ncbi:MAG: hypothetical protein QXP27_04835 [Candidatus Methanomethyliaceae archaeon]